MLYKKINSLLMCYDVGQIEVFTWSASGTIITETLASSCPTVVVYVMDTVRSVSPVTFMSNMLYACSILYKTRLPFIVVMNKVCILTQYNFQYLSLYMECLLSDKYRSKKNKKDFFL